jgi:hypothetical protein
VPFDQKEHVARAIDSFLMRPGIARMSNGDYNRLFVLLMDIAGTADPHLVWDAVVAALAA